MKAIKVICPKCGNQMVYKNWFSWILHTPFHWFGKRRIKCSYCKKRSYVKGEKFYGKYKELYNPSFNGGEMDR